MAAGNVRMVVWRECDYCNRMNKGPPVWCSECLSVAYCSERCRARHWKGGHGRTCCRKGKDGAPPPPVVHPCSVCKAREDDEIDGTSGQCRTCGVLICRRCTEEHLPDVCPACKTTYDIPQEVAVLNMLALLALVETNAKNAPPERIQKYAHNFLGGAMLNGDGIPQDKPKAGVAFHRACQLGHAPSMFTTARALIKTDHVVQGLKMMGEAAGKGYAPAAVFACKIVRANPDGPFTKAMVRDWLSMETCQRNPAAMYCLGDVLEELLPIDLPFASIISLYGAGASMGSRRCTTRMERLEDEALAWGDTLLRRFVGHWRRRTAAAESTST